jgi:CO dehydrogenase maturation factor
VDMEAGIEHFGRGTVEAVDAMLVVAEPSMRSLETARRVSNLAKQIGIKQIFLVGNRVSKGESKIIEDYGEKVRVPVIGIIPSDEELRLLDAGTTTSVDFPASPGGDAIRQLGEALLRLAPST